MNANPTKVEPRAVYKLRGGMRLEINRVEHVRRYAAKGMHPRGRRISLDPYATW